MRSRTLIEPASVACVRPRDICWWLSDARNSKHLHATVRGRPRQRHPTLLVVPARVGRRRTQASRHNDGRTGAVDGARWLHTG